MNKIKVLNLYAGIGGNRKLWRGVEVTAVENNKKVAQVYKDYFPEDKVIIADAHKYLLEHFKEFNFIWSSPPCKSHSRMRKNVAVPRGQVKPCYVDMRLWQEILFLEYYFKGLWVVENVEVYYNALIKPKKIQRHYFWSNFFIPDIKLDSDNIERGKIKEWEARFGFNLDNYGFGKRKDVILKNCVHPKLSLHIFNSAYKVKQKRLIS